MSEGREPEAAGGAAGAAARLAVDAAARGLRAETSRENPGLLVFLPSRDAQPDLGLQVLGGAQVELHATSDPDELIDAMVKSAGAVLLAEESLDAALLDRIGAVYLAAPVWSALPIIVVSGAPEPERERLAAMLRAIGVEFATVLSRPANPEALLVAVYTALRARRLQYRFRDALRQREPLAGIDLAVREEPGEELFTTYDTAPVGLCLLDRELRYLRVNQRLADINGLPVAQHIGRRVGEVTPGLESAAVDALETILRTGEPKLDQDFVGQTAARPGEDRTWVEQWYPLRDSRGQIVGVNVIVQDVTEKRQAEEALEWSYRFEQQINERMAVLLKDYEQKIRRQMEELRRLAQALSSAEHDERERIAGLLHGGLQQTLAAVRMQLQSYADTEGTSMPDSIDGLLEDAIEMTRTLVSDVSATTVPGATLHDELEWLRTWSKERYALELGFECDGLAQEPEGSDRLFLLQCLRELLLNVSKHAGTGAARLSLRQEEHGVVVRFEDDGAGFDPAADARGADKSFGLASIRSRAAALGWDFRLESEPNAGTRIQLHIPSSPGTEN